MATLTKYPVRSGGYTNCQHTAEASYMQPTPQEEAWIFDQLQASIRFYLLQFSMKDLAKKLDLNITTLVRLARWKPGKAYRKPSTLLAIETYAELHQEWTGESLREYYWLHKGTGGQADG